MASGRVAAAVIVVLAAVLIVACARARWAVVPVTLVGAAVGGTPSEASPSPSPEMLEHALAAVRAIVKNNFTDLGNREIKGHGTFNNIQLGNMVSGSGRYLIDAKVTTIRFDYEYSLVRIVDLFTGTRTLNIHVAVADDNNIFVTVRIAVPKPWGALTLSGAAFDARTGVPLGVTASCGAHPLTLTNCVVTARFRLAVQCEPGKLMGRLTGLTLDAVNIAFDSMSYACDVKLWGTITVKTVTESELGGVIRGQLAGLKDVLAPFVNTTLDQAFPCLRPAPYPACILATEIIDAPAVETRALRGVDVKVCQDTCKATPGCTAVIHLAGSTGECVFAKSVGSTVRVPNSSNIYYNDGRVARNEQPLYTAAFAPVFPKSLKAPAGVCAKVCGEDCGGYSADLLTGQCTLYNRDFPGRHQLSKNLLACSRYKGTPVTFSLPIG